MATKAYQAPVREQVANQLAAFGVDQYEIGLIKFKLDGSRLCKRFNASAAKILAEVNWLQKMNAQGWNINIVPKAPHGFVMLDDVSYSALRAMAKVGFEPCLVIKTSRDNYQAWIKYDKTFSPEAGTAAAKDLATLFGGDPGAASYNHFSKLAGFTNRKPRHLDPKTGYYPFVQLIYAEHRICRNAQAHREYIEKSVEKPKPVVFKPRPVQVDKPLISFDKFQDRFATKYGNDQHRIDFAYAVLAIANGMSDSEILEDLKQRPGLEKKGGQVTQLQYLRSTVRNAHRKMAR
jgi:hypothetical protein